MYSTLTHPITSAIDIAHTLSTATVSLATDVIVSTGGKVATNSVVAGLLENGLIRVMEKQIKYGRLTLILLSGKSYTFGPVASPSSAKEVSATTRIDTRLSSTSLASSSFLSSTANTAPHSPHPADSHFSTPGTTLPSSSPRPNLKNLPEEEEVQPNITVKVLSNTFFLRLLLSGDLGFAEAYMAGECLISYTTDDDGSKGCQELDEGYYGSDVWEGEKGEREGEVLLDLFKIAIRSDHPSASSSLSSSKQSRASGSRGITGGLDSLPKSIFQTLARYTSSNKIINSVRNSVGNIRAHYDISNRMFASFLSPDMTYSCAIFPELDGDLTPTLASSTSLNPIYRPNSYPFPPCPSSSTDPLETAQYAKLDHIIHKAKIPPGARVLEIGSGWGSMAIRCVQLTGCTVDTLTLSTQQKVLAEERIKKAGLEGSITVHLMDFRSIPESWYHTFDRVVSIEMLEAVGKEYIQPYFKMIDDVLNEKGVAVFQVITIPEARFENYAANVDFIQKWIFPGGFLPSVAYTTEMISKGSRNRLGIDSIVNIGPHYARTLREWRIRFLKNFDRDIRPALKDEHPEMSEADVEVFKRKWIYYFVYCEIGFAERMIGDHIFSISREGNRSFGSDIYA